MTKRAIYNNIYQLEYSLLFGIDDNWHLLENNLHIIQPKPML